MNRQTTAGPHVQKLKDWVMQWNWRKGSCSGVKGREVSVSLVVDILTLNKWLVIEYMSTQILCCKFSFQ